MINLTSVLEDYYASRVSRALWIFGPPVLLVMGTIGNILSVIVLQKQSLKEMSVSFYLSALAIADTLALYIGLLNFWLARVTGTGVWSLSSITCKFYKFLLYTSNDYCAWILVIVSVQRFIAVYSPFEAKILNTKQRAILCLSVLLFLLIAVNLHLFWTFDLRADTVSVCDVSHKSHHHFVTSVWPWVDFSVGSFVPFLILIVCNAMIIRKLVERHHDHQKNMNVTKGTEYIKITNMTVMLLTVTFVFLCLTSPIVIYNIGEPYWLEGADDFLKARLELASAISHLLLYLNNAVNFLIYCVSGPAFRKELRLMFC